MKKITFILSLVSLSLTVASAQAAVQFDQEVVEFSNHEVSAPRFNAAEKSIEQSLSELRAEARRVSPVRVELPSLGIVAGAESKAESTHTVAVKLRMPKATRS